ncbi:NEL-type E3 ubiquitin ligase domain-containing protein [Pseudomonas sp. QTF5]|uniref:NEL-type E3 ubiquitin ligase domain-containing protein n=1 Tax=Pseudomonas sp. QTF5 TaxID=1435425 RepID=UPI0004B5C1B4|nr:NEL-type E3 ubiquitin ligase domain-containing protein [Pseudomonas sp. QTF5]
MTATTEHKGQHDDLIKSRIDSVFTDMSLQRSVALRNIQLRREPWMITATRSDHKRLAAANKQAWSAQNNIDKRLSDLKDVYSFAEPLLKAKLREQYNVEVDVKNTYLRLYAPKEMPWYVINVQSGSTARTVSLLDAALHNFAYTETYQNDSDFIIKIDPDRELFDVSPVRKKITISQFQTLCRELDIGAQYKAHLESYLLNNEPVADAWLRIQVERSQQAALNAAAHLALVKKDISHDAFKLIFDLLAGRRDLTLDDQAMQVCDLGMMDLKLTGIVVICPDPDRAQRSTAMIAYVPHDPEHPLKQYASSIEFMDELTRLLRDNKQLPSTGINYRQFFSQFVDHEQRGHFFTGLEQRLTCVKWYPKELGDPRPSWRDTPVENPRLQFSAQPITTPLWTYLYQQQLNKILNDARGIAVPTADADSNARWAWWENFRKIVSDIFNVALLVLTPFVPGLGEVMLAYTAYQLTTEVIEGVVDLATKQWAEAAEHLVGFVTDIVQLAAFGAGTAIGNEFRLKLSPLVEGMKPVQSFDGTTRLWNPDLKPYEQPDPALPATSRADALGLHEHAGKKILPLEGKLYEVKHDPKSDLHRIQHPTRPQTYSPEVRHNGQGAWIHEGENPHDWEGPTLMRRLGHSVEGYTDTELERLRSISGTSEGSLRRMYVENAPPPPLLADTLSRFKTWDEVNDLSRRIRTGQPLEPGSYWFDGLVPGMPGWPADKALKVYETADLTKEYRKYGNASSTDEQTLGIGRPDMLAGKLPGRLVDFLGDAGMQSLLGQDYPKTRRAQALRNKLADTVENRELDIFNYQDKFKNNSNDARVRQLQRHYPELPSPIAQTIVDQATAAEIGILSEEQRIPLRLKNQARESAFEVKAARAYAGFHQPELLVPDTERLALNALKVHTDSFADLRIEVRDGTYDGPLRCSAGSDKAAIVRELIRDEYGRYEVTNGTPKKLQAEDVYEAILLALPEDKRNVLGYQTGKGSVLKQWVMDKTEPPAERRKLLAFSPIRPIVPWETDVQVYGAWITRAPTTVEAKVRNLYPHFDENEIAALSRSLHAKADPHQEIARLKLEQETLKQKLEDWRRSYLTDFDPDGPLPDAYRDFERNGGRFLHDRLKECFDRKAEVLGERNTSLEGGYSLDLSTEFLPHNLERWWKEMPKTLKSHLQQITTLNLDGQTFLAGRRGLLKDFAHLQQLSARKCGLTGLPENIGKMQRLETLRLSDNQIQLSPSAIEQLQNLSRLEILRLDNNPLGAPPFVNRMPSLKVLNLANTDIKTWPPGLFSKARPTGLFLDLRKNALTLIPDVAPGSDKALLIARTRLDASRLSDANRVSYERYRESVGMPAALRYDTPAADLLAKWPPVDDTLMLSESPGIGTYRPEAWHDLMAEPDSEGFFTVLESLTQSADYRRTPRTRAQLTDRVWRMVDAASIDTPLREELFSMSNDPEGCEDAGAELFNNMGVRVLAWEARNFSTTPAEVERKLVTLAKGSARLERVGELARADIKGRGTHPDEVEVHLAYDTGLAKRLDLPWQSEAMNFRPLAGVTDEMIDNTYDTIIDAEAGDGLVNQMITRSFWEQYLRRTWPNELASNSDLHYRKLELLEDLKLAQKAWAEDRSERPEDLTKLIKLAEKISVPQASVLTGEEMSDETYEGLQRDIAYQRQELSRKLTREAMERAGL